MANSVPVSTLITLSRQRANMEASQFVTDSEILSLLERANRELYDMLVQSFAEYYISSTQFTLIPGQDLYPVPTDFYKLQGVDLVQSFDANQRLTLKPFMFAERNQYGAGTFYGAFNNSYLRYNLEGNNLRFRPLPQQAAVVELFYVPVAKTLTVSLTPAAGEQNAIDAINGYDEYLILDAAINMLIKEESDVTALQAQKQETIARVTKVSAIRDIGMPPRVTDVYAINNSFVLRNFM